MALTMTDETIRVVDTDAHISEPADLWTSRLPSKWQDIAPHVERDSNVGADRWRVGDEWLFPVGIYAHAGWHEFAPGPPTLGDADPAAWDPHQRLVRIDEFGIDVQV